MALNLHAIASYSAMQLIDSLAEGFVVCLVAALLLRVARRQNAGTRFAIGFSALLAIALLPFSKGLLAHSQASLTTPAVVVPESWAVYLFSLWGVIALLLLARVARSVWHLHKVRSTCVPLDPASLPGVVAETLRRKQTRRPVVICTSEKVGVPTALGLIRPSIVIPGWVMKELPAEELNQVILHELAHLRRWDDWTNLAQQIVKALFFFHPAVWWIEKKIAFEREMACDDAVLAATESPRAYAECLAHLAEKSFLQRSVALAQALVGRIAQTSQRVAQILDVNRPKGNPRAWKPAVSAMIGVGMLCSVWAARTPELVGFGNGQDHSVQFARRTPDRQSAPVTNATFIERSTSDRNEAHAIAATLRRKPVPRNAATYASRAVMRSRKPVGNLVHLSAVQAGPVRISETVLVVVESGKLGSANAQICHIQMWRFTVLPVTEAVGSKTPSKKI